MLLCRNGYCVIKIFQIVDQSLPYDQYKAQIQSISHLFRNTISTLIIQKSIQLFMIKKSRHHHSKTVYHFKSSLYVLSLSISNKLSFFVLMFVQKNDRSIILTRPYIKDNLFYRLQTRPYLTRIEKKWIAYQLLIALKHIHDEKITHGDLKIENILLTSYNWILLSDFANFKPTFFAYVS